MPGIFRSRRIDPALPAPGDFACGRAMTGMPNFLRSSGKLRHLGNGGVFPAVLDHGHARVVVGLEIEPEAGADAESGPQPDGAVRRDATPSFDQVIDAAHGEAGGMKALASEFDLRWTRFPFSKG